MFVREIFSDRKFLITGGALFLSLLLFIFFPSTDRLSGGIQSAIIFTVFFLIFPLLYAKFILGEPWQRMGFRMDGALSHWVGMLGAVVVGFVLFFFGYQIWPALQEAYRLPFSVERSFLSFVRYEMFAFTAVFFYEVFFRGFVMFLFLRPFGRWAILLQWFIFLLFLVASQSFEMSQAGMILFAPLAGWIAYRSQSILYSFIGSAVFLFLIDIFLLFHNLR
ncbi:MAG: hypothetical protein KA034_02430 [Candidatus Moranbacteria bacterium]|nr:hypothetical protein [Candidatus Moranbacteria bacterium]